MKKVLLGILLAAGFATAVVAVKAVQQGSGAPHLPPFLSAAIQSDVDSRLVDVEKACRADEVTIEHRDRRTGEPRVTERGDTERECRRKVVNRVFDLANAECQVYAKVKDADEQCKAHRGNLNATEDISFDENRRTCTLTKDVKYTCN